MNTVFFLMLTASLVALTAIAPDAAFSVMLTGAEKAVETGLSLFAVYAVWLSVLEIMEKTGISRAIYRLFAPLFKKMFKGESEKAVEYISLNVSANLLGMGSAATPAGIKAMEHMSKKSEKASDNMILFFVINATSVQLIPATIVGMRAAAGSASPSDIILPTLGGTLAAALAGVALAKFSAFAAKKGLPLRGKLARR